MLLKWQNFHLKENKLNSIIQPSIEDTTVVINIVNKQISYLKKFKALEILIYNLGWYALTFLFLELSYSQNFSKNFVFFLELFLE